MLFEEHLKFNEGGIHIKYLFCNNTRLCMLITLNGGGCTDLECKKLSLYGIYSKYKIFR